MVFQIGHLQSNTGKTHWKKGHHVSLATEFKKGVPKLKGKLHFNWMGGKSKVNGYTQIYLEAGKYRAEHILKVEQKIKRCLFPNEIIHHINYNRSDNRIENLYLMSKSQHSAYENNVRSTYFKWINAENFNFTS